jgi:arylsulfatase A-like enzyme
VDVAPTLLAAACGDYPRTACSGRDLRGDPPRHEVVAESRYLDGRMIRGERWKYVEYFTNRTERYLFDMQLDPEETRNVIAQHPEIADRMRADLSGYLGRADEHQIDPGAAAMLKRLDYF